MLLVANMRLKGTSFFDSDFRALPRAAWFLAMSLRQVRLFQLCREFACQFSLLGHKLQADITEASPPSLLLMCQGFLQESMAIVGKPGSASKSDKPRGISCLGCMQARLAAEQ